MLFIRIPEHIMCMKFHLNTPVGKYFYHFKKLQFNLALLKFDVNFALFKLDVIWLSESQNKTSFNGVL